VVAEEGVVEAAAVVSVDVSIMPTLLFVDRTST
jgi:hypothetical protein